MTEDSRTFVPAMGKPYLLPFYDPLTWLAGVRKVHRGLLSRAAIRSGERVLDVGCGTGTVLRSVAGAQPGAVLTGVDPDPAVLGRARRKAARSGITFVQGFADALPVPDDSVDVVLSSFMLHHVAPGDKSGMMREIRRVLRPGGRLHLVDMLPGSSLAGDVRPESVLSRFAEAGLAGALDGEMRFRLGRVMFYRAAG